jgi:hypothetical protein
MRVPSRRLMPLIAKAEITMNVTAIDYLVKERLHHRHGDHCGDHGPIQLA